MRAPPFIASLLSIVASLLWGTGVVHAAAVPGVTGTYLQIGEVFVGTAANPGAQYIVLRQQVPVVDGFLGGAGYALQAWDTATNMAPFNQLNLDHNVILHGRGATVLIATPQAATFFNVVPDFFWLGAPIASQGVLCVVRPDGGYDDCLIYGDAAAANPNAQLDPNVVNAPFNQAGGIPWGAIVQRYRATSSSDRDFWLRHAPWPQNSAGVVGRVPAAACGNGVVEGLESCDAGAACGTVGGSCTNLCQVDATATAAVCGNGILEAGESCDDDNTIDLDGCSSTCQWEYLPLVVVPLCGNGRLEAGEACDAGLANGGGTAPCTATCASSSAATLAPLLCGNGAVESPAPTFGTATTAEQCDLGSAANGAPGQPCTALCRWQAALHPVAVCGNGAVEPSEECDDGNRQGDDGCSPSCKLETTQRFVCGDGALDPGEACDHGANNGTLGDTCTAACRWAPGPAPLAIATTSPATTPASAPVSSSGPTTAGVKGGGCSSFGHGGPWPGVFGLGAGLYRMLRRGSSGRRR